MAPAPVFSLRNRLLQAAVGSTALIALFAGIAGFIWFPSREQAIGPEGLWQAICTAAGVSPARRAAQPIQSDNVTSTVILTAGMLDRPSAVSIGRGATLALQCAICHGVHSARQVDTPDLAGQFASAIYKELHDFKTGARVNAVMSPQVVDLTDQDILDLAAYYSYLPTAESKAAIPAPAIVVFGAPMRNIPPCAACHGGLDVKPGAPRLEGESATYIRNQLTAFVRGTRRNDINKQMRNIARQMTEAEIDSAARYYSPEVQPAPEAPAPPVAAAPEAQPAPEKPASPVVAAPEAPAVTLPQVNPPEKPGSKSQAALVGAAEAVFPSEISPAYAREKPEKAFLKTCSDQYHANAATNSNGGLKRNAYLKECKKRLKG